MKKLYLKFIYYFLKIFAIKLIKTHNPIIIAITGSVGKTSTKEAIYQVLYDEFGPNVRKNHGNLNAEIGLPLTILGYKKVPNKFIWPIFLFFAYIKTFTKKYPKYLVLEMGIEKKGDMKYLTSIVQPNFVVITSTTPAHIGNFESIRHYQEEKISLLKYMKEGGIAVINYDDLILRKENQENIISFAIKHKADYMAENISTSLVGTEYRITCTGYKVAVKSKIIGKHLIYSQLAAFAIGDLLGISRLKIGKSLEKITPLSGRMNILEGRDGTILIDDTYNSNPTSAKAAIDLLQEIKYENRKVLIFGNMNELGKDESRLHREIGLYANNKFDLVLFVGKNSLLMANEISDKQTVLTYSNRNQLIQEIPKIIKKNDLILIKASQNNNYFEEITKALMKDPSMASKKLVRQESFWKNKK